MRQKIEIFDMTILLWSDQISGKLAQIGATSAFGTRRPRLANHREYAAAIEPECPGGLAACRAYRAALFSTDRWRVSEIGSSR